MDRFAHLLRGSAAAAADLALCALVGGAAAGVAWAFVTPVGPAGAAPAGFDTTTARPRLSPAARVNDLFGASVGAAQLSSSSTSGDITLHATRTGVEGAGSAILSFTGQPQQAVFAGDMIADGARLTHVGVDHVEVERSGVRERIGFSSTPIAPGFIAPPPINAPDPSETTALAELGFRPALRNGETRGFEYVGGDPLALDLIGIEPGDILIAVNGRSLDEGTLAAHRTTLLAGGPAQLTLERGGAVKTIQLGSSR